MTSRNLPGACLRNRHTSNSARPRCRCSGRGGPACRRGPARCGACCPRRWRDLPLRTSPPNSPRSGTAADPDRAAPEPAARQPEPEPEGTMTQLKDLMNTSVVTVAPETTVSQAAAGMVRARVGSVVVMQGSFLAGILTERDVLRAAGSGEDLTASLVTAWMSADPQAASLDTTAEEAAQIMLLNGFRHLPVLDGRAVVGVVSIRDLFAAKIRRPAVG